MSLPPEMDALPEDCCSLGQTIDYYQALESLGEPTCDEVLRALRDVTADDEIARRFETEPGFRISLIRFSEPARIYHFRPQRLHRDRPTPVPLQIRFEASLPGFSDADEDRHEIAFDLHPEPGSVGRLAALVGKNGTGKTQLLARLATALSRNPQVEKEHHLEFSGPPVGRVIAVSYNALDTFATSPHDFVAIDNREARPAMDSYRYCGLRDREGSLNPELIFYRLGVDMAEITALERVEMWKRMVDETRVAENEPHLQAALESGDVDSMVEATRRLGAGQKMAITVLTRVLASIRNGAVVTIDEPEVNLHPSLLAALLRVLHGWLDHFDGYGIIATHSPIGLQEIPGRNVRVLRRVGPVPLIQPYPSESFGQGLSEIVAEVFGVDEQDKNYVTVLRDLLASGASPEQIEVSFGRPLTLNARMALRALAREGASRA
ncbi:MAG: hypothetical protein QM820_09560 [Minicystis sp.]